MGSLIAAATLAVSQSKKENALFDAPSGIALAFLLPAIGIVCSIVGFFAVNTKEGGRARAPTPPQLSDCNLICYSPDRGPYTGTEGKGWNVSLGALMWALEKGMYLAGGLFVLLSYFGVTFCAARRP